jgi:hypothetical protein
MARWLAEGSRATFYSWGPVMAGLEDDRAAGAAGRGCLPASYDQREQAIDALKAAFIQGLLDKDEFDLRLGQAFASRTYLPSDHPEGQLPAACHGHQHTAEAARRRFPRPPLPVRGRCAGSALGA